METVSSQQIYYQKKHLWKSIVLYIFGLCLWFAIYFFTLFVKRPSNVPEASNIIPVIVFTVIFVAYAARMIGVLIGCITSYKNAPTVAYKFTAEGVFGVKKEWFAPWSEIHNVASIVKNEGLCIQNLNKERFYIHSWWIDPAEIKLVKNYILKTLPENKTKRIS